MRRILITLLTAAVAFPAGASARETGSQTLTPANIVGDGIRTIAVVPINFAGQRTRPTTQARLGNMFFNSPDTDKFSDSLASYWEQSSYGRERIEGKVFGLTPIDGKSSCNMDLLDEWANQAETYWASRGEYLDDYDHVFLVMPYRKCDFGGWASIPGRRIVINQWPFDWATARTRSSAVIGILAHELVHNLGFDHSGVVHCIAQQKKVSLGGDCKETDRQKYDWDPYELITSGGDYWPKHLLNSFQRVTLGFILESEQVRLDSSGIYNVSLNPIEFSASATKALIVRRTGLSEYVTPTYDSDMTTAGAPDICIEWHQPKGWFNNFNPKSPVVRGISMRLCDLYSGGVEYALEDGGSEIGFFQAGTRLIDATPGSKKGKADWTDAQLTKGIWTDEFTGITIRVVGFDKPGTDRSQWSANLEVVIP